MLSGSNTISSSYNKEFTCITIIEIQTYLTCIKRTEIQTYFITRIEIQTYLD